MQIANSIVLFVFSLGVGAAEPIVNPPLACAGNEYLAFDFWVGEWEVWGKDGKLVGTNSIQREVGGCVLHERYETPRGYLGESFNTYDASRKVWHQTWVDSAGLLLLLDGGIRDGAMVLEGVSQAVGGPVTRQRITWTPEPDGTVRQLWESSGPDGEWTIAFDGTYRRKANAD